MTSPTNQTKTKTEPVTPIQTRKPRRDRGSVLLTARDELALRWIGEQYGMRLDQLCTLLGRHALRGTQVPGKVATTTASGVVSRWLKAGLVRAQKFRVAEPCWVWLTRAGLSHLGLGFHYRQLNVVTLDHVYWVNQTRLAAEQRWAERGEARTWACERSLKRRGEKRLAHLPDAVVDTEQGRVAVEVELTAKKRSKVEAILRQLVRSHDSVWYFCTPQTQRVVEGALKILPVSARSKIRVMGLQEIA